MCDENDTPQPIGFERFPLYYYEYKLDAFTSHDGQIYLATQDPSVLLRAEPSRLIETLRAADGHIQGRRVAIPLETRCRDCGELRQTQRIAWRTLRCGNCLSRDVEVVDEDRTALHDFRISSPRPEAPVAAGHTWGESLKADTAALIGLQALSRQGERLERELNVLAMFTETLLELYDHRFGAGSPEAFALLFPVGTISQRAFREGGLGPPGDFALRCFLRARDTAPDARGRAIAQHSLGMIALDAYQQADPQRLRSVLGPGARETVIAGLDEAIGVFRQDREDRDAVSRAARTEYCLADLLLESHPTDDEVRRAHAIMQRLDLDLLVADPDFGVALRYRAMVECCLFRQLEALVDGPRLAETVESFGRILNHPSPNHLGHRAAWYALHARVARATADKVGAINGVYRALFCHLKDEAPWTSIARAEARGARLASTLAMATEHLAGMGWWSEALAASETLRAQALQAAPDTLEDRQKRVEQHDAHRSRLYGRLCPVDGSPVMVVASETFRRLRGEDPLDFGDDYELPGLSERMLAIFHRHRKQEMTLLSLDANEAERPDKVILSAVLVGPPRKPSRMAYSRSWAVDRSVYEALLDRRQFDRRSWREAKLAALIPRLRQHLIDPIRAELETLATSRVLVVAPARWGQLPLEAALGIDGGPAVTFNAPSLMFETPRPKLTPKFPRALVVASEDEGLPGVAQDCANVMAAFDGRCTVMKGGAFDKRTLIEALREPYEHILVAAHAVSDDDDPGRSRLVFRNQQHGDGFCLTADDLVEFVRLPNAPSILLAACSSGIVGSSRANNWSGLAGGFLRAGARAVIASRWVVLDADAAAFVKRFYASYVPGKKRDALTAFVQAKRGGIAARSRLEDWAAFAYLGEA